VVVFQSVFCAEMHQNNVFLFFKKLFFRSVYQNDPKHIKKLIFSKKFLIFLETLVQPHAHIDFILGLGMKSTLNHHHYNNFKHVLNVPSLII